MKYSSRQSGITIVEVMVALAVAAAMIVAIGYSVVGYVTARENLLTNTKALYLAEEGYEIVRALRDENWSNITAQTVDTYIYLDVATTTIAFTATPEVIDGVYRRSVILRDAYRDGDDDLTASTTPGATIDTDSRELVVFVANENGTTTLSGYITNYFAE